MFKSCRLCFSLFSGQIGLFYLVYYSCLAGFFAVFLALFFTYVNSDYPVQQDMATMLKNNPGECKIIKTDLFICVFL